MQITIAINGQSVQGSTEEWLSALVLVLHNRTVTPGVPTITAGQNVLQLSVCLPNGEYVTESTCTWVAYMLQRLTDKERERAEHAAKVIPALGTYTSDNPSTLTICLPHAIEPTTRALEQWIAGIAAALPGNLRTGVFSAVRDKRTPHKTPGRYVLYAESGHFGLMR